MSRENSFMPKHKHLVFLLVILTRGYSDTLASPATSGARSSQAGSLNTVMDATDRIALSRTDPPGGKSNDEEVTHIPQDEVVLEHLASGLPINKSNMVKVLLQLRWDKVLKQLLTREPLEDVLPRPTGLGLSCYHNLLDFIGGLVGVSDGTGNHVTEKWALQMLDAYGKPSAGLLKGVFQWVGNYEECLGVRADVERPRHFTGEPRKHRVQFGGKYCRLVISFRNIINVTFSEHLNKFWLHNPTFPTSLKWGVCVPETCSSADVKTFLTQGTLAALNLPVQDSICFQDSRFSQDVGAVAVVVLLCVASAVVILCTSLDIYYFRPWLSRDASKDQPDVIDTEKVAVDGVIEMKYEINVEKESQSESSFQPPGGADVMAGGQRLASSSQQARGNLGVCRGTVSARLDGLDTCRAQRGESLQARGDTEAAMSGSNRRDDPHTESTRSDRRDDPHTESTRSTRRDDPHTESTRPDKRVVDRLLILPRKPFGAQLIQGLSLYRNACHLLCKTRSQGTFDCIQGMRVISLAWIVVGHCYTYGGMLDADNLVFENTVELVETSARLSFHIVGSAQLAVDTFFVISGCLTMLVTLRLLRRHKPGVKFWSTFMFHRFWRLTPMYMIVLILGMTLYDHIVQGPLKSQNLAEFDQCRHKWWSHLLYINNFYQPHSKCMTWSWFMAVDMQLFLISPIFIYTVHRNLQVGMVCILLLLVVGVVLTFVSEYVHGGQFVLMDLSFLEYWSNVYTMPWTRASVFAVGLALGVALYKHSGKPLVSKWKAVCVWLVVTALAIFLVLINHSQWKHGSENWTRLQQSFFESLVRPTWSICMAWVVLACCTDLGGYANVILSWRPFLVLSKLTYSLYLLHPMLIMFVVYSRRTTIYLDPANLSLVYNYIGSLTLTFLLSAVLSLMFEMPMTTMEYIFCRAH